MHVLVITPHYIPDGGPSAPLYALLCEELVKRGHMVTVIAGVPHYPSGKVPQNYRKFSFQRNLQNGVNIIRVPLPSLNRSSLPLRFLQFLCYQLGATLASKRKRPDVVIASNPALQVGIPFMLHAFFQKRPSIFSIHDVYPDVGIELGIFRHKFIVSIVSLFERFCLKHATYIRILSESFLSRVAAFGIPNSKIILIYDWVDTHFIRPLSRINNFAQELGLVDKFVILYAGNLGFSQGLENVLSTAKILEVYNDIHFVFVGGGANRERLISISRQLELSNVLFLPFQPRQKLPEILATADVSLVSLKKGISFRSLPSKIYSILASGRPLIACVDKGSDSWKLVERSGAGICIPPESPEDLAESILKLKSSKSLRSFMSEKGRNYALRFHSPQSAADHFEEVLKNCV